MRTKVFGLALALVLVVGLFGCGSSARDTSTPSKGIIGHWRNAGGLADSILEMYYGPNSVTWIGKDGTVSKSDYMVASENQKLSVVTLKYKDAGETTYLSSMSWQVKDPQTLNFVSDHYDIDISPVATFNYVDSKQTP